MNKVAQMRSSPRVALLLMTVIYAFNFMDRQVLAVLAEPIKRDLGLSDTEIGLLGGMMFAIFYTTFGIPVAWLADRWPRVRILASACAIWSLCCAACGLATNFGQLAAARIGVGLGEAGGVPPSYSLISDLYAPHQRARALATFSLGVPIGLGLGSAVAGWIAAAAGWRLAIMAVGLPGLVLALLFFLLVPEPRRGRHDVGVPAARPSLWNAIRDFYARPEVALPAISCAIGAVGNCALMAWLSAYLIRVLGMRLEEVGTYLSITVVTAMSAGTIASGWLVDRFGGRDRRTYVWVPCGAMALSLPFYIGALTSADWRIALPLFGISLGISCAYLAPTVALVQDSMPAAQRSTGGALLLFAVNLIGLGGGPVYVGLISDLAAPVYGTDSLLVALYGLTPFFILAVVGNLLSARVIGRRRRDGHDVEGCHSA